MRRALAIRTKLAGPQSREVAATLVSMAKKFGANERVEETEQLYAEALAIYEKLGNKARLAETLTAQRGLYANTGRHKEATLALERVLVVEPSSGRARTRNESRSVEWVLPR